MKVMGINLKFQLFLYLEKNTFLTIHVLIVIIDH